MQVDSYNIPIMDEQRPYEITPVQPRTLQPAEPTTADHNIADSAQSVLASLPAVDSYRKRIKSTAKWFKILGLVGGIGICLAVVLGVLGLSSKNASFVNIASNIVGISAIPLGIIAGLWYSQVFRYSINVYDQQKDLADNRALKRMVAFKHLKLCLYISIGVVVVSIFASKIAQNTGQGSIAMANYVPIVLRAVSSLVALVVFILTITSVVRLFRNREKNYVFTGLSNSRTHWALRWLFFIAAFLNMGIVVGSLLLFLYLQLYSHWCNLTNSKCY